MFTVDDITGLEKLLLILQPISHRRHGQDKTVLSCLVRVGGVNTVGDKTRQLCLVSTQFPICICSASNILRISENLKIGNWVETRQNSSKLGESCLVCVGGVNKLLDTPE